MPGQNFKALVLRHADGKNTAAVETLTENDLPPGDVLVRIRYSDVNYKDGMAIIAPGGYQLVEEFPFVPGIDFAGTVEKSDSADFQPGDEVILTGFGVGDKRWGGFAELARVQSDWLVKLPAGLTLRQAMALGTAGFSAMLCVDALERYGIDKTRDVLVTGAGGGVGSVALLVLHRLGYSTIASSGRREQEAYLRRLGADSVIERSTLADSPSTPLLQERWGGVVDTVGGTTLAHALASTAYGGAVASLGLAGGRELHTTVVPFIARGVGLLGVDSVYCPMDRRRGAWQRLAALIPDGLPDDAVEEIALDEVPARAAAILAGQVRGRTIVAF